MITLEYLEEYESNMRYYEYEIKRLIREINLETRKTTADSVSGSAKNFPYTKTHYKVTGVNLSKIKKLNKRKKYFESKKRKLEEELEYKLKKISEEDSILADIIRQRYKDGRNWNQIARNCNYSSESGPRNLFFRFFYKK